MIRTELMTAFPRRHIGAFLFAVSLVARPCAFAAADAPKYRIVDLHVLGAAQSAAVSINNAGQIVGAYGPYSSTGLGPAIGDQSFILNDGQRTLLGTLGGPDSWATAISENGYVAGASQAIVHGTVKSVLYVGGAVIELGSLGGPMSLAFDVNIHGHVVGWAENSFVHNRAFIYRDGAMVDLGTLGGGWSEAWGINDLDQVVGQADTTFAYGGSPHAFLYTAGTMIDLGTFGGDRSKAQDINDLGQVVGYAYVPYTGGNSVYDHTFLYSNGEIKDIGTLGGKWSEAVSINNLGQIVGYAERSDGSATCFLYSDGLMYDLRELIKPTAGWEFWGVGDINDRGQIVGYGKVGGQIHAFVLDPVPEPMSGSLVAWWMGTVITASWLKRSRRVL